MIEQHAAKPVVAAFDFDGTLTRRDTLFPFLLYAAGPVKFFYNILLLSPTLAAYALGFLRNDLAKNKVLHCFLAHKNMTTLQQLAINFAALKLPKLLRSEAMQRLHWHQQQGHRCVVVSASLEIYLQPWASKIGIEDVLGSKLAMHFNGTYSGNLDGENCFGIVKMQRLEALLGSRNGYTLYAYGDSRGDKELLSAADFPFYKSFTKQGLHS